jgi:hypothetical protein
MFPCWGKWIKKRSTKDHLPAVGWMLRQQGGCSDSIFNGKVKWIVKNKKLIF